MKEHVFNMAYIRKRVNAINARYSRFVKRRNKILEEQKLTLLPMELITVDDYIDVYIETRGRCGWCGQQLHEDQVDHITPISKNGRNIKENITICCSSCNHHKYTKHPAKFLHEIYNRTHIVTPNILAMIAMYSLNSLSYQTSYLAPAKILKFNEEVQKKRSA